MKDVILNEELQEGRKDGDMKQRFLCMKND